jgi:acetyltransferase-like isoleucine patch superfamily enzyme
MDPGERELETWLETLLRWRRGIVRRIRAALLKLRGVQIVGHCWVQKVSIPRLARRIRLESCMLDDGVTLLLTGAGQEPAIRIGYGAYINRHTMLDAVEQIEVGEYVMIGPFCYITDHDHGTAPDRLVHEQPMQAKPVRIGRGAWIGAGVTILKGVNIGEGAIIGAGAVVTRDVPPSAKVAGVPARVIGQRHVDAASEEA